MISVIIAAKDAERWIQKTIDSLRKQTYKEWNCIISINGSSDDTENIAKSISDTRFNVITSNIPNKSLALNRAIISSTKDWICILDADDLWTETKLEEQISHIAKFNSDITGTQLSYIDEFDKNIPNSPVLPTTNHECVEWLETRRNPIANSSVIYKRLIHDVVGYYDPEIFVEDYDLWMRSKRAKLKFSNIASTCLLHRIYKTSNFNSSQKQKYCKDLVDEINVVYNNINRF